MNIVIAAQTCSKWQHLRDALEAEDGHHVSAMVYPHFREFTLHNHISNRHVSRHIEDQEVTVVSYHAEGLLERTVVGNEFVSLADRTDAGDANSAKNLAQLIADSWRWSILLRFRRSVVSMYLPKSQASSFIIIFVQQRRMTQRIWGMDANEEEYRSEIQTNTSCA